MTDWVEDMPIPQKYQTQFAKLYRERLTAEIEGREWVCPPFVKSEPQLVSSSTTNIRNSTGSGLPPQSHRTETFFAVRFSRLPFIATVYLPSV